MWFAVSEDPAAGGGLRVDLEDGVGGRIEGGGFVSSDSCSSCNIAGRNIGSFTIGSHTIGSHTIDGGEFANLWVGWAGAAFALLAGVFFCCIGLCASRAWRAPLFAACAACAFLRITEFQQTARELQLVGESLSADTEAARLAAIHGTVATFPQQWIPAKSLAARASPQRNSNGPPDPRAGPEHDSGRPVDDLSNVATHGSPARHGEGTIYKFLLESEHLETASGLLPVHGPIRVEVQHVADQGKTGVGGLPSPGDRVCIAGRMKRTSAGSRHVQHALVSGPEWALVTRTGAISQIELSDPSAALRSAPERARAAVVRQLQQNVAGDALGFAVALTVGSYSYISRPVLDAHVETGAIPFLAISGQHFGILIFPVLWYSRRRLTRARGAGLAIVCIVIVALLAGGAAPVHRAATGATLFVLAPALGRRMGGFSLLSTAAAIELLVDPRTAMQPGFQLSYAAVAGFIIFLRPITLVACRCVEWVPPGWIRFSWHTLCSWFLLGFIAFFSTAGITSFNFERMAPAALLVSLPLSLLFPPMIACSWICAGPSWIAAPAGAVLGWLAEWEIAVLATVSGQLWQPPAWIGVSAFFVWSAGLFVLCALAAVADGRFRGPAILFGALCVCACPSPPGPPPGNVDIYIYDVGHGLAATAFAPDGSAIQIDAGSGDGRRADQQIVRTLRRRGVRELLVSCISHDDADHYNLYPFLLMEIPTRSWVAPSAGQSNPHMRALTALGRASPAPFSCNGLEVEFTEVRPPGSDRDNDHALVVQLRFAGRRVLFPGDLEPAGLQQFLRQVASANCDVAVLPHHGLDNGQLVPFLDAVRPALAIASNGNRFRSKRAAEETRSRNIKFLETRTHGTLWISIGRDGSVTVRPLQ